MRAWTFLIMAISTIYSCKQKNSQEQTNGTLIDSKKIESEIILPIKGNFINYCYFQEGNSEFFSYEFNKRIYTVDLKEKCIVDSMDIFSSEVQENKYGTIRSFFNEGRDSLYVALNDAVIFYEHKKLREVIPINHLDTVQYKNFLFFNLENSPIYYDKKDNEIIGEVYCSTCAQSEPAFYSQKIFCHINMTTHMLSFYEMTYPSSYIQNYFGFGNHVYTDCIDSFVLFSFPYDKNIYVLNREHNTVIDFSAESRYQKTEPLPLSATFKNNTEKKMRSLTTNPYYCEVRYDRFKYLYYRFLKTELPLKRPDGKYNTFRDKKTILTVLDTTKMIRGEYELPNSYSHFVSFVGKEGLYLYAGLLTDEHGKKDSGRFKILTFNE